MATTLAPTPVEHPDAVDNNKPKRGGRRAVLYVFLTAMALTWVFPVAWAVFNSFRDYDYTSINGYVSFGGFTLDNYTQAWQQGGFSRSFWNSVIITVPRCW
jgi:multiple sugar transport system permease protein